MKNIGKTIYQVLVENNEPNSIVDLLYRMTTACKYISNEVNRAGMADILGKAGSVNVQGEEVQKLDIFSNDVLIDWLNSSPYCSSVGSEENEDVVKSGQSDGELVVAIDPLDGSSNIDVTAPIGTIFSVFKRKNKSEQVSAEDFFQKGTGQVAAGYVIYGSSTMLVLTTGKDVDGYTLDMHTGEFVLTHPGLKMPEEGKIYSINEGYDQFFEQGVNDFLKWCKEEDKSTNRPYAGRYIGSLVADFHRTLIKGGIFMYPATAKSPSGKLRLVYEAQPLALIAHCAGGLADSGSQQILDIQAKELHQRVPLFIGSKHTTEKALSYVQNKQTV